MDNIDKEAWLEHHGHFIITNFTEASWVSQGGFTVSTEEQDFIDDVFTQVKEHLLNQCHLLDGFASLKAT